MENKSPEFRAATACPMPENADTRAALARMAETLMNPSPYVTERLKDGNPAWRCPYCGEEPEIVTPRLNDMCECGFHVILIPRLEELADMLVQLLTALNQSEASRALVVRRINQRVAEIGPRGYPQSQAT